MKLPRLRYDHEEPANVRSTIAWTVFVLILGYIAFNAAYPNNDVNVAIGVLQGTMATMVLCYYFWWAIKAIWKKSQDREDYLIAGIVLAWISTDGQAWLSVVARLAKFPPEFVNSELFAPVKLISVVAAVLHVIPKGAANGVIPRGNKKAVSIFFGIAFVLATLILAFRPDPKPWIDRMPSWSKDTFRTGQRPAIGANG